MPNRKYVIFGIAFILVILGDFPLLHGDLQDWLFIVFYILRWLLTAWIIIALFMGSKDLKPLILGVLTPTVIVLVLKNFLHLF